MFARSARGALGVQRALWLGVWTRERPARLSCRSLGPSVRHEQLHALVRRQATQPLR
jgi:hypothetical protein